MRKSDECCARAWSLSRGPDVRKKHSLCANVFCSLRSKILDRVLDQTCFGSRNFIIENQHYVYIYHRKSTLDIYLSSKINHKTKNSKSQFNYPFDPCPSVVWPCPASRATKSMKTRADIIYSSRQITHSHHGIQVIELTQKHGKTRNTLRRSALRHWGNIRNVSRRAD